ncbi:MAG: hypothetical protein AB8I08_09700 [Sandaracinaceae bacterium]
MAFWAPLEVRIDGERYSKPGPLSAMFVEVVWPEAFFAPEDETLRAITLRYVEQCFVHEGRAYATFAMDSSSERT